MLDVDVRTRGGEGLTTCGQRGLGEQVLFANILYGQTRC